MSRASRRRMAIASGAIALLLFSMCRGMSVTPLTVAVADFDYVDSSGEVRDQSAEHSARVAQFAKLVRDSLGGQGDTRTWLLTGRTQPWAEFWPGLRHLDIV